MSLLKNAKYCYVAKRPACGCVVRVRADEPGSEAQIAYDVLTWKNAGFAVEWMPVERFLATAVIACPHETAA